MATKDRGKIISILFILCFLNGNFVIAQKFVPKKLPAVRTTVRVPNVRTSRVPNVRTSRVPNVRTHVPGIRTIVPYISSVPDELNESASRPSELPRPSETISIDLENRGFVPEEHLSISQEQQSFTIESNDESVSSPHIVNTPKVNLDKIRMKIMMKRNRLNKDEMITDEFIFIGILINHDEYGEYCITSYAA